MNNKRMNERKEENQEIHAGVKVWLEGKLNFFGPGTVKLLETVDKIGSVREACTVTNMSYSKGWKLIHKAEEQLGYTIVERSAGGKTGGKAVLTDRGRALLDLFEEYEARVEKAAKEIYDELFHESVWHVPDTHTIQTQFDKLSDNSAEDPTETSADNSSAN